MHNGNTRYRNKETEEAFESIMMENFPKLMSDTKPQIWKAHQKQQLGKNNNKNKKENKKQNKKLLLRRIIFKLQKI